MKETSYFRAKVSRGTCYGSNAWEIEFRFTADDEFSAEISDGLKKKEFKPKRDEVENYLSKIFEIIEKEEVFSDLRHVETRYHTEIEWQNLDSFAKQPFGELKMMSNEWHIEQIEEAIIDAEKPEIAERLQKVLDTNPHQHALEIYTLTMNFCFKYRMDLF